MKLKRIEKILAISTTGIGNMVLYTPVLKTLRSWFPEAKLTLLCGSIQAADVVRGSNMVDDIWILDKTKFKNYINILRRTRKIKFNMVVISYLDKSFKVGMFVWNTQARIRLGYNCGPQKFFYNYRAEVGAKEHEVQQNLRLLNEFNNNKEVIRNTEFFLDIKDKIFADKYLKISKSVFGFHPGAGLDVKGNILKRWNVEKFAEVADKLADKCNAEIIIFGGQGEENLGKAMSENMKVKPVDLTGKLSIKKTAALIKRCKLFITNDSGLMHIAASFGVPVVAIFGPTLYWKNYPWNTKHKIVRKELDCGPCSQFKNINCKHAVCMEAVTVDEVYKACVELIKK